MFRSAPADEAPKPTAYGSVKVELVRNRGETLGIGIAGLLF